MRALVSAGGQAEAFAHVSFGGEAPGRVRGRGHRRLRRRAERAAGRVAHGGARLRQARRAHDPRLRSARCHGRTLGRRDRPPLLRALLPDAARDRRHRVLVDRRLRLARRPAARGRAGHAMRARRGRPPRAHREGRRPPARRGGQRALPQLARRRRDPAHGHAGGRAARDGAAQPARAARPQPDRPRSPGRRLAERDLACRARPVRPLARHAARPLASAQRHARRVAARRRRARLPAGPPP